MFIGVASKTFAVVPTSAGYVTDEAGLLTPDQIASLNGTLAEYEQRTSNQIVVLTIKSLEGQDIASYGIAVAEAWKVGDKQKDNGAILLIAPNERKVRIEVGYGLEGVLTDAKSAQIIRNIVAPRFQSGDYAGGITDAVSAMEAVIGGEFTAEQNTKKHVESFFPIIVILLFIAGFIGLTHWTAGATTGALLAGGLNLFTGIGGIGLIGLILAIVLGLVGGAAAPFFVRRVFDSSRHGMGGGEWSGRSGFGGGGGFGGFSGGGGGFGGGGASGRW